jgi:hypothetical protein
VLDCGDTSRLPLSAASSLSTSTARGGVTGSRGGAEAELELELDLRLLLPDLDLEERFFSLTCCGCCCWAAAAAAAAAAAGCCSCCSSREVSSPVNEGREPAAASVFQLVPLLCALLMLLTELGVATAAAAVAPGLRGGSAAAAPVLVNVFLASSSAMAGLENLALGMTMTEPLGDSSVSLPVVAEVAVVAAPGVDALLALLLGLVVAEPAVGATRLGSTGACSAVAPYFLP